MPPLSLNLPIAIALPAPRAAISAVSWLPASLFELAGSFLPVAHHGIT